MVGIDGYQTGLIEALLKAYDDKATAQKARKKMAKDDDFPLAGLQVIEVEVK